MPEPKTTKNRQRATAAIAAARAELQALSDEPASAELTKEIAETLVKLAAGVAQEPDPDETLMGAVATIYHAAGLLESDRIEVADRTLQTEAEWIADLAKYDTQIPDRVIAADAPSAAAEVALSVMHEAPQQTSEPTEEA